MDGIKDLSDNRKKKAPKGQLYLQRFKFIYEETTGSEYEPDYALDHILLSNTATILKNRGCKYEEFFRWVCQHYHHKIQRYGLKILRTLIDDYLEFHRKSEL